MPTPTDKPPGGDEKPSQRGRFRAGKSGNPRGRPKKPRSLRDELARVLKEKIAITQGGKQRRISRQEAMMLTMLTKALSGDMRATTTIMSTLLKLEPKDPDQGPADEPLTENDEEIVANFLRRNRESDT